MSEQPKVHPPIAYVDTETTSLSAEYGKIWEFAGIRYDFLHPSEDPTGTHEIEHTPLGLAKVTRIVMQIDQLLGDADPMSLKIGMFYERFGKNGEWNSGGRELEWAGGSLVRTSREETYPQQGEVASPDESAKIITEFLLDTSIFGNTINFDHERLERHVRGEGYCPTWHYHPMDVKTFAAGVLTACGHDLSFPLYSSEISDLLGVEQPEEGKDLHTAMGDARWTRDIHWAALERRREVS